MSIVPLTPMQLPVAIVWLASWYPTRLDPLPGDFIQRHARALSLYKPLHVLHIAKDEAGIITKDVHVDTIVTGNLTETIVYYHPRKTGFKPLDKVLSFRRFMQLGKQHLQQLYVQNPNMLLHVHVAMRHGLLALWAQQQWGIPYAVTEHWTGYHFKDYPATLQKGKWFWKKTKQILNKATVVYPVSTHLGQQIQPLTRTKLRQLSNVTDTAIFYPAAEALPIKPFRLVHVSTMNHQKNTEGIVSAFAALPPHYEWQLTLAGPANEVLEQQVQSNPALRGKIHFTGTLSNAAVAALLRDHHAMVMFSRYENQPCSILEALCSGLPVISSNVGGIPDLINDSNGLLVNPDDEQALLNAIQQLMYNYHRYNHKAIAAAATALYSYETIGKQQLHFYQQDFPGLLAE